MNTNHLGYYTVGDQIFFSKISALISGTDRGLHPEWQFNQEFFNLVDWTENPEEDIYELYRQRAQTIRDRYDYLILMYSGGSDSQTIFDVCIENNIKIDELVVVWAESLSNSYTPDATNHSWTNVLSEWDYTIRPRLQKISQRHPNIKITVHDWVKTAQQMRLADDFIIDRNHNFTPYAQARWNPCLISSIANRLDSDQRVGLIFGTDKPRICIQDGFYRLYFLDIVATNVPSYGAEFSRQPIGVELFYWSPDSWRILAKQCHLLMNFFQQNPQFKQFIQWPITNHSHRQFYETISRAIVYPRMDLRFFQVEKPRDMNFGLDTLLFQASDRERLLGIQKDNFAYLQKIIDPKYFNIIDGSVTLVGFIAGMWPVGPA